MPNPDTKRIQKISKDLSAFLSRTDVIELIRATAKDKKAIRRASLNPVSILEGKRHKASSARDSYDPTHARAWPQDAKPSSRGPDYLLYDLYGVQGGGGRVRPDLRYNS